MRNIVRAAAALLVAVVIIGCGGGQQPAKVEKPAEPAFVAQTVTVAPMKVASIAKMGPYADAGKAVNDLMAMVQKEKLNPTGMPYGVYFDNPTTVKPESTRYEICIGVPPTTKNKADKKTGFAIKDAPLMTVAQTAYMGPYDKVAPTYEKLFKWIADNKLEAATPPVMVEWYLSDPSKVKPESLMANVAVTLKPPAPAADTTKKTGETKKTDTKNPTKK
jgi:AraC family transcriptional regulator